MGEAAPDPAFFARLVGGFGHVDPKDKMAIGERLPPDLRTGAIANARAGTSKYVWVPNAGPQTSAYFCEADELLFGGSAGGGKSDILLGLALTAHRRSLLLRRINQDAAELGNRLCVILGSNAGYASHPPTWSGEGRLIEMRGCEHEKDKERYKGRPHDLIGFDELADFSETQYRFIIGWNRSAVEGQRCRVVAASNPPTKPEGQWIVRRWAPWIDPNHPNPAGEGELRWFLQMDGNDIEVDGPGPHDIGRRQPVRATSRTFIRSTLDDNPDLARDGKYQARLDGMAEEYRRAYSDGDFSVGMEDDDFQVLPIAWIEAAMQRWEHAIPKGIAMTAIGLDVAQGGADQTVAAARYGAWYAPLEILPGKDSREGFKVCAHVVRVRRDRCPVVIDIGGGYGADAIVSLKDNGIPVVPFNGVLATTGRSLDRQYGFKNKRAESYWRFREALNPEQEGGSAIALPPDPLLKADLASVRWENTRQGILLEKKEDIKERIGRSPDRGDAVVMALSEGDRAVAREGRRGRAGGNLPQVSRGFDKFKQAHRT